MWLLTPARESVVRRAVKQQNRIATEYGGRRAWLSHLLACGAMHLGLMRSWRQPDLVRVRRLVFVCKGNICRSAYAERKARSMNLPAISCGLRIRADMCPPDALATASARGVDLSGHRPRSFEDIVLASGDLMIAMEPMQANQVHEAALATDAQVTLLGLFSTPRRPWLQDPYGLSAAYFSRCFEIIDSALTVLAAHLHENGHDAATG